MTSEVAKKIAERIELEYEKDNPSTWAHGTASQIADMFRNGYFDDLIAPSGRPVLSDDAINELLCGAEMHYDERGTDPCEFVGVFDFEARRYEAKGEHERAERSRRIGAELRAWEAYLVAKREAPI